jgi:hypothetical protein
MSARRGKRRTVVSQQLSPTVVETNGSSTMTIDDTTKIGPILCAHLPTMADVYFQYCSTRAQANRWLQAKMDSSEPFRNRLTIFQQQTSGLSLSGFLTKPIQRVTRYPLLIEKVLKHTSTDHNDHRAIEQALQCARLLNERINQQISEQESSARLDWLQRHLTFGMDDNSSDGYLFDELLKFNSLTKYHTPRKLIFHGLINKVCRNSCI